jgi:YbgC/YbaW family acyl-CoA thioester hydrolase
MTARREDFTLAHRLRVRWAEVDMQHVVFNANYLLYFDVAIADYWRAIGSGREVALAEIYMRLYTVKAVIEYHAPARYDEEIDVCARVVQFGRSSMNFAFGIWRGADHLVSGELVYVHADPGTGKAAPIPQLLKDAVLAYERMKPEPVAR